jgi:hypothetical protein
LLFFALFWIEIGAYMDVKKEAKNNYFVKNCLKFSFFLGDMLAS